MYVVVRKGERGQGEGEKIGFTCEKGEDEDKIEQRVSSQIKTASEH